MSFSRDSLVSTWIAVILGWLSPALGRARYFWQRSQEQSKSCASFFSLDLLESCTWGCAFPHTAGLCLQGEIIGD